MSTTDGTELTFAEKVESDKRSIFEQLYTQDLLKYSQRIIKSDTIHVPLNENVNSDSNAVKSNNIMTSEEFAKLFEEDDVDDSEEIFQKALEKAEELAMRDKELKKKNPFYQPTSKFPNPCSRKPRKRKSKVIEETENIINAFKESLAKTKKPEKFPSTCTTVSTEKCKGSTWKRTLPTLHSRPMKIYPSWKSTANYTPIFPAPTNPRWSKGKLEMPKLTSSSKMYTPGHIYNWMANDSNVDNSVPPSCKTIRSDAATWNSVSDEESFSSPTSKPIASSTPISSALNSKSAFLQQFVNSVDLSAPMYSTTSRTSNRFKPSPLELIKSPVYSSSPMRSTTVRFKPSPPERILYSDGNSTVSSLLLEENYSDQQKKEYLDNPAIYPEDNEDENKGDIESLVYSSSPIHSTTDCFKPSPPEHILYSDGNSTVSSLLLEENYSDQKEKLKNLLFYPEENEDVHNGNIESFKEDIENFENYPEQYKEHLKCKRHKHFTKNDVPTERNKNISNASANPEFFENFIHNLNSNIRNNCNNMQIEYSMKVKYFS